MEPLMLTGFQGVQVGKTLIQPSPQLWGQGLSGVEPSCLWCFNSSLCSITMITTTNFVAYGKGDQKLEGLLVQQL